MNSEELKARMNGLLGFRVTERENDAVVEFFTPDGGKVRAVRPAHAAEVTMYVRLLGFVARLDEVVTESDRRADGWVAALKIVDEQETALGAAIERARTAESRLDEAIAEDNRKEQIIGRMGERIQRLNEECDRLLRSRDEAAGDLAAAQALLQERMEGQ